LELEWIKATRKIIHDEFDHSYKTDGAVGGDVEDVDTSTQPSKVCFQSCQQHSLLTMASKNIFDNLPALPTPGLKEFHDKNDCFLSTDLEHVSDILRWWHEHCAQFLQLS